MRPGVDDAVTLEVMRPRRVVPTEAELQHLHAGHAEPLAQRHRLRRDEAEVLRDHRLLAERLANGREESRARTTHPLAALRGARARRHLPRAHEPEEVVEPHHVEVAERVAQAIDPPVERRPCVVRVAPQLPGPGKVVARHPGLHALLEQLRVRAHIRAVLRHEKRHVADQANAALACVALQCHPRALERELFVRVRRVPAVAAVFVEPARVAPAERLRRRPVGPDPVLVARERALGRIRRAAVAGRSQRQQLPPALAGLREEVDKPEGVVAKPAVRQGGDGEQQAAGTHGALVG